MTEEGIVGRIENDEQRRRWGWPWFALNVILFPAPAHLTMLRVTDFNFRKSIIHLGVTGFLFFILLGAGLMQIVSPGIGRFWMLIPFLSGVVILYLYRSIKSSFKPFNLVSAIKERAAFLAGSIFIFAIVTFLPDLNLIELSHTEVVYSKNWILRLQFWQQSLLTVISLSILFVGYVVISTNNVSISRVFILYACYVLILSHIYLALYFAASRLKIQGGFCIVLTAAAVSAILALDYWDAKTFGQYTRRYFFLTCTKGFTFIFFFLCFFGLPQKIASFYSTYYYEKVSPAPIHISPKYLFFNERDRFKSMHDTIRQMRTFYTRAFLDSSSDEISYLNKIVNQKKQTVIPADSDISRLAELVGKKGLSSTSMEFNNIPLFRPIKSGWDVMLTALVLQGTISETELYKYISGFKAILPKTSQRRLPGINTPNDARYLSSATGASIYFIPPVFENIEYLSKNKIYPVLSLRLSGNNLWAALLSMDHDSGIAWFRIETLPEISKSIQLLFDSNKNEALRNEILSRVIIPVSIDYLKEILKNSSFPVIIFNKKNLEEIMPDQFDTDIQKELDRSIAPGFSSERWATNLGEPSTEDEYSTYAFYLRAISHIRSVLTPENYGQEIFSSAPGDSIKGEARIRKVEELIERISPLSDHDRTVIASLMVKYKHVHAATELFIKLASQKAASSDLIGSHDAFLIGRRLLLLGYHEEALGYLELAFQRYPFDSEYEQWYHIAMLKLNRIPPPLYSPANHQPYLSLYVQTISDVLSGNEKTAMRRLEKALEKDSHDSLANHLLSKYFNRPLNDQYFFPTEEGL